MARVRCVERVCHSPGLCYVHRHGGHCGDQTTYHTGHKVTQDVVIEITCNKIGNQTLTLDSLEIDKSCLAFFYFVGVKTIYLH